MFPLLNMPSFWCMSRSRFIIRMAIRPPVDPFRIYKIGPCHFPPFKRPFQEGPCQEGHTRLIRKRTGILFSFQSDSSQNGIFLICCSNSEMGGAEKAWMVGEWLVLTRWCIRSPEWGSHDSRADWLIQPIKKQRGAFCHPPRGMPHAPMITDRVGGREVCEEERCVILERQRLTWLPASSHISSSPPASHPLPDNARLGWILSTPIQLRDYTTQPLILSVAFFGNPVLHNHCGEIFTGRFNCHINWFKSDNFQPVWTL